jgi:hypothetical protein
MLMIGVCAEAHSNASELWMVSRYDAGGIEGRYLCPAAAQNIAVLID